MRLLYIVFLSLIGTFIYVQDVAAKNMADDVDPVDILEIVSVANVLWTITILTLGYIFVELVSKILGFSAERSSRVRLTLKGLIPIVRILLWAAIIAIIIRFIFNPPLEMLITAMASVALAVGFAAQDLLKNVFGGLMISFDRPFQVGDKIKVGDHYGEVIDIGLRTTRITTPDDSMVVIPNMELMNSSVSNANTGEIYCQVVAEITLPIDIDTQQVRKIAIEAAQVSKYVYLNKPIDVHFFNVVHQRRSYLKMRLKAYVMDIRYEFPFKSDMTEILIKELFSQGIVTKEGLE
jgi:MscS family membrane protein